MRGGGEDGRSALGRAVFGRVSTRLGVAEPELRGRASTRAGGGDGDGFDSTRSDLNGVEPGLFERTPSITRRGIEYRSERPRSRQSALSPGSMRRTPGRSADESARGLTPSGGFFAGLRVTDSRLRQSSLDFVGAGAGRVSIRRGLSACGREVSGRAVSGARVRGIARSTPSARPPRSVPGRARTPSSGRTTVLPGGSGLAAGFRVSTEEDGVPLRSGAPRSKAGLSGTRPTASRRRAVPREPAPGMASTPSTRARSGVLSADFMPAVSTITRLRTASGRSRRRATKSVTSGRSPARRAASICSTFWERWRATRVTPRVSVVTSPRFGTGYRYSWPNRSPRWEWRRWSREPM